MRIELQKAHPLLKDTLITLLFGVLSGILGTVAFAIPGVVNSDLREIPFLICLFYLRSPLFIFPLGLWAFYAAPADMPVWVVYQAHLIPLFIAYFCLKILERSTLSSAMMGVAWVVITIGYYLFALLPLIVFAALKTPSLNSGDVEFSELYWSSLPGFQFEIIASSLVTGFYLMQMKTRRKLEETNKGLEEIVTLRTNELTHANNELQALNEELTASNEGVRLLNENLEQLVKERTDKIKDQLEMLRRYAYMNSHELRAPLARILGLLQLLDLEHKQVPDDIKALLIFLQDASSELDNVIRHMNRLLEKEIPFEAES